MEIHYTQLLSSMLGKLRKNLDFQALIPKGEAIRFISKLYLTSILVALNNKGMQKDFLLIRKLRD
jgi:hypothetical protein